MRAFKDVWKKLCFRMCIECIHSKLDKLLKMADTFATEN